MKFYAVIGDLVSSKQIADRAATQRRLAETFKSLNRRHPDLASPYTLTLGDEFQALYSSAKRILPDVFRIAATLRPVSLRVAIAHGPLSTPLNPEQSIGMDGPVFHDARATIDALRKTGKTLEIADPNRPTWSMANHGLHLITHQFEGWNASRCHILSRLLHGETVEEIARGLSLSTRAIYKNIQVAALKDIHGFLDEVTRQLRLASAAPD